LKDGYSTDGSTPPEGETSKPPRYSLHPKPKTNI